MPDAFTSHHNTYKEHELHLTTNNQDRVKTAWQYIYSHGCTGRKAILKAKVKGARSGGATTLVRGASNTAAASIAPAVWPC